MKIESKKYIAFSMNQLDKNIIIDFYANEDDSTGFAKQLREYYANLYVTPTEKNYLFTKSALELIDSIKISDNPELRQMVIDNAESSATYLLSHNSFIRYYDNMNKDGIQGIYYWNDGVHQYYEAFNILPEAIHHPKYINGESVPEIDRFLKMMIFVRCTNTETVTLDQVGGKSQRRIKLDGEKYINESDKPVVLVNARYNKIVIRDEPFWVNTHGRFQRYGKGNSEVKYIIIEGYYKKGYKREYA